jgi:hypothetical protein
MFSERSLGGEGPMRRIVRLGARLDLGEVSTLPARYRGSLGGPQGTLVSARLRARTSEIWCRLRASRPFARAVRTIPLTTTQPPAPTPDALDLRPHERIDCLGGRVGHLEGVVLDAHTGLTTELLIRVRHDVAAEVERPTDPLAPLLGVQGQRILVPPSWASKAVPVHAPVRFMPDVPRLMLNASAAQVARCLVLRGDAELTADIWAILAANPAIEPSLSLLRVSVREGVVTLLGSLPTSRHRLSAEQDIWHVPGVLAVHNEVTVAD